jgi:hypothetical protein
LVRTYRSAIATTSLCSRDKADPFTPAPWRAASPANAKNAATMKAAASLHREKRRQTVARAANTSSRASLQHQRLHQFPQQLPSPRGNGRGVDGLPADSPHVVGFRRTAQRTAQQHRPARVGRGCALRRWTLPQSAATEERNGSGTRAGGLSRTASARGTGAMNADYPAYCVFCHLVSRIMPSSSTSPQLYRSRIRQADQV